MFIIEHIIVHVVIWLYSGIRFKSRKHFTVAWLLSGRQINMQHTSIFNLWCNYKIQDRIVWTNFVFRLIFPTLALRSNVLFAYCRIRCGQGVWSPYSHNNVGFFEWAQEKKAAMVPIREVPDPIMIITSAVLDSRRAMTCQNKSAWTIIW